MRKKINEVFGRGPDLPWPKKGRNLVWCPSHTDQSYGITFFDSRDGIWWDACVQYIHKNQKHRNTAWYFTSNSRSQPHLLALDGLGKLIRSPRLRMKSTWGVTFSIQTFAWHKSPPIINCPKPKHGQKYQASKIFSGKTSKRSLNHRSFTWSTADLSLGHSYEFRSKRLSIRFASFCPENRSISGNHWRCPEQIQSLIEERKPVLGGALKFYVFVFTLLFPSGMWKRTETALFSIAKQRDKSRSLLQ